ncbi:MAG: hypothetical protein JSV83_10325 [Desulfobacterales bacterium]|nr:MAG: hypothetical protein JSV83_10325 [Desulfobacterales bacterium]
MSSKNQTIVVFKLLMVFILISLFLACNNKIMSYRGRWVEEADRLVLQDGGPHKGRWQTRDVVIEYQYIKDAKSMQISGVVKLADHLKTGFTTLEYLNINVISLDNGIVLDSKDIKTFGYRRYIDYLGKVTFETRMDLSEGAVAIAFSYSGKVIEGGGRGDWSFWKVPRLSAPKNK